MKSSAEERGLTRAEAIAEGAGLGADEASRRRETGVHRQERINRAMAYAAWDYDGRNPGNDHLKEFGVDTELTPSLERALVTPPKAEK